MNEKEEQLIEEEENILSQVMTKEALEILRRVCFARGDKGKKQKNDIISLAKRGGLRKKIDTEELKHFLEKSKQKEEIKVDFIKRDLFDSD